MRSVQGKNTRTQQNYDAYECVLQHIRPLCKNKYAPRRLYNPRTRHTKTKTSILKIHFVKFVIYCTPKGTQSGGSSNGLLIAARKKCHQCNARSQDIHCYPKTCLSFFSYLFLFSFISVHFIGDRHRHCRVAVLESTIQNQNSTSRWCFHSFNFYYLRIFSCFPSLLMSLWWNESISVNSIVAFLRWENLSTLQIVIIINAVVNTTRKIIHIFTTVIRWKFAMFNAFITWSITCCAAHARINAYHRHTGEKEMLNTITIASKAIALTNCHAVSFIKFKANG